MFHSALLRYCIKVPTGPDIAMPDFPPPAPSMDCRDIPCITCGDSGAWSCGKLYRRVLKAKGVGDPAAKICLQWG